jgi:hypothetical protein
MYTYTGPRAEHRPNSHSAEYGPDTRERRRLYMKQHHDPMSLEPFRLDGDWGYHFNSLGYRCQEYEPAQI